MNLMWGHYFGAAFGFVMFFFLAYAGIYVTCAALVASVIGTDMNREFTISAFYNSRQRTCDYKLALEEVSPAMGDGFCVGSGYRFEKWRKGSKVTLYGRESILGFRFTHIVSEGTAQ